VTGRLEASLEAALRSCPGLVDEAARVLVEAHFPATVAPDVLVVVGRDPELLHGGTGTPATGRRRSRSWPAQVLEAWDRQCAFCGFGGQVGGVPVGLEAAHIRWFTVNEPDEPDNGLALCLLHHKLFDRGVLGLDDDLTLVVSQRFSARTPHGRAVYGLQGRRLRPRPGTPTPATRHIVWHREQVFR
jgi:putative restriction endonuclease